jgi:hypothetical protein
LDNIALLELNTRIIGKRSKAAARTLIDSGATGNFINQKYAEEIGIATFNLENPMTLKGANNSESSLRKYTNITLGMQDNSQQYHEEKIQCYIGKIGTHDILLGMPWLRKHNPEIDWVNYKIYLHNKPKEVEEDEEEKPKEWEEEYSDSQNCSNVGHF